MRVVIVTHYYSTHRGGIELVAAKLAAAFSNAHQVEWISSDCDEIPTDLPVAVRITPMTSTNIVERLVGVPFPIWSPTCVLRLWKAVRCADVVHMHDYAYAGNWFAFLFARMNGIPVLITQHIGFVPYKSRWLRLGLQLLQVTAGRIMLGTANQVVFVSTVVRDYFQQHVRFRTPPQVIANGVETTIFTPGSTADRGRARAGICAHSSRPLLLFVGRFVEKKGLGILKQLVGHFKDVDWIFAGWGPFD